MSDNRQPPELLTLSAVGLAAIVAWEGFTSKAIIPVPGDPWTFGFGSTTKEDGSPVNPGDVISPHRAVRLAVKDIAGKETVLKGCIKAPLTQKEWDLYVGHAYNVGPYKFCGSTFVKRLNALDYTGACDQFLKWKFVRGLDCSLAENSKICGGVWSRRLDQYQSCLEAQP